MQVAGRALFPGAGMFEACTAATSTLLAGPSPALLHSVSIAAPLIMPPSSTLQLALAMRLTSGVVDLTSSSWGKRGPMPQALHCRAGAGRRIALLASSALTAGPEKLFGMVSRILPVPSTMPALATEPSSAQLFSSAIGLLEAPHGGQGGFGFNPAALDSMLQLGLAFKVSTTPACPAVPVGLGALCIPLTELDSAGAMPAALLEAGLPGSELQASYSVHAPTPFELCQLGGLQLKALPLHSAAPRSASASHEKVKTVYETALQAFGLPQSAPSGVAGLLPSTFTGHHVTWRSSTYARNHCGLASWNPSGEQDPAPHAARGLALLQVLAATQEASPGRVDLFGHGTPSAIVPTQAFNFHGSCTATAATAALVRVAASEAPSLQLYSLQGSPLCPVAPAQHSCPPVTDQFGVAIDGGALFVPRLLAGPANKIKEAVPLCRRSRVIVTGGLGDLGLLLAIWLGQQPGIRVQLVARTPHGKALPNTLASSMGTVIATMANSSAATDIAALSWERQGELAGIAHAGGVLRDAVLANQTAAGMRAVMGPKTHGMLLLCRLAAASPLAHLTLFSSIAALLGSAGQANYAAANATLSAGAATLQQQGFAAVSLVLGAWAMGMATSSRTVLQRIKASGVGIIEPAPGLDALVRATRYCLSGPTEVVLAPFQWPQMQRSAGGLLPPIFEQFALHDAGHVQPLDKQPSSESRLSKRTDHGLVAGVEAVTAQLMEVLEATLGLVVSSLP